MENNQVMEQAAPFFHSGNRIGVLVIHGFTGTTQSMHFLGEQLAAQGYTVYGPRLTGHGTTPEDMEKSTYEQWITSVESGLKKLEDICDEIFVTGLSMGGTLTLYLAENHPSVRAVMPINAAVEMPELMQTYDKLKNTETRFVDGIGSDIKQVGVKEIAYAKTPIKSMGEIIKLCTIVKNDLANITVPIMIFSSVEDHVVPPQNSKEILNTVKSKNSTMIMLNNSYHVATLDHDKALIAEKCVAFIKTLTEQEHRITD